MVEQNQGIGIPVKSVYSGLSRSTILAMSLFHREITAEEYKAELNKITPDILEFCRHCDNLGEAGECLIRSVTLEDRIRFIEQGHCGFALSDGIAVNMTHRGIQLKSLDQATAE